MAAYSDVGAAKADFESLQSAEGDDFEIEAAVVMSRDADGKVDVLEEGDGDTGGLCLPHRYHFARMDRHRLTIVTAAGTQEREATPAEACIDTVRIEVGGSAVFAPSSSIERPFRDVRGAP